MNITTTIREDGVAVLAANGRINLVTAPTVRREVQRVVDEGHARLTLDLSQEGTRTRVELEVGHTPDGIRATLAYGTPKGT
ncbi:hypothetical protein ACFQ9V_02345 [Leifsonia sp. NPDC056665]|uniref:hypothetical protein n=1 Tax=Leifsonia sp. NPDC056665 TaxID=3345901 RepID=UPI003697DE16